MVSREIRGLTPEMRQEAREQARVVKRDAHYAQRVQTAQSPRRKLVALCDYARAVADDLHPEAVLRLCQRVADAIQEAQT